MQQLQYQVKDPVRIQRAPHDEQLKALEAAIKSIRKTRGYGNDWKVTYEWPKAEDLWKMFANMPTKIIEFRHATSSSERKLFGAFQVVLSNGMASPVMKAEN